MACLRDDLRSSLDILYEGDGDKIARDFYIPVLKRSTSYNRVSGYFSVDSLTVVAAGLAGLVTNNGKMKLILGAHDLGNELREAYIMSQERAEQILREIGERIASGLEKIEDIIARRRIEALAWMLAKGTLEVKVAIPKRTFMGLGNGIFHEKVLLFTDSDDCKVAAAGSANETFASYHENGENLTIHMSWRDGSSEYLERYQDRFDSLWSNSHPDYYVLSLPEAVEAKLKERFYPESRPRFDPLEDERLTPRVRTPDLETCMKLAPVARLVKELGSIRGFAHLGLGPVRLYPHQVFAVDFVLGRFPHRALLADEVGLGKTLEAGAVIKRLLEMKRVQRILVLSPRNVSRQWLDELWYHFGLRFWLYEPESKGFVASDGSKAELNGDNPFEIAGVDFMIASWHYARGSKRRQSELTQASRFFDLVVVDEAHNARMKRELGGKVSPTKLNELCMWLSVTSPNILLMTATPVQLHSVEALDLLRILGIGGPWVHEADFASYYKILGKKDEEVETEEWMFAFRLASWAARNYLTEEDISKIVNGIIRDRVAASELVDAIIHDRSPGQIIGSVVSKDPTAMKRILLALSPVQWFMVRNTRERLEKLGYSFPRREPAEEPVNLERKHQAILENLDTYLSKHYAKYERYLSQENRGVLGFVRSIYHQRFVSSFAAAYLTIRDRIAFLQALLDGDRDALLRAGSKLLVDEDWDGDEEDLAEAMDEAVEKGARELIVAELGILRDLANSLQPYDPQILSGDDPKMKKIVQVVDQLVGQGHKVLVFSKYTDTVDAVVRFLARNSVRLSRGEIGVYTGAGGQIFDADERKYKSVGKEEVRKSLEEGPVRVLICSDAASEGLNLQSASAVVNVDMPWNPSRVEQRIGRSDRLGQKAAKVLVRNVWYPDSIEAHMYRVLFDRQEIYKLVVGPAQEIVSEGLRRALDSEARADQLKKVVNETLERVQAVQGELVRTTGSLSGSALTSSSSLDDKVVRFTTGFGLKSAEALGYDANVDNGQFSIKVVGAGIPKELARWNGASLEAGKANALTPGHPLIQWLADKVIASAGTVPPYEESIYVVRGYDGLGDLAVLEPGSAAAEILSAERVVDLFDQMLVKSELKK